MSSAGTRPATTLPRRLPCYTHAPHHAFPPLCARGRPGIDDRASWRCPRLAGMLQIEGPATKGCLSESLDAVPIDIPAGPAAEPLETGQVVRSRPPLPCQQLAAHRTHPSVSRAFPPRRPIVTMCCRPRTAGGRGCHCHMQRPRCADAMRREGRASSALSSRSCPARARGERRHAEGPHPSRRAALLPSKAAPCVHAAGWAGTGSKACSHPGLPRLGCMRGRAARTVRVHM